MAIQRQPEFQKDYAAYIELNEEQQKAAYDALCRKWEENIHLVHASYLHWKDPASREYYQEILGLGIDLQPKPVKDKTNGRYLYIRVDLHAGSTQLEKEFRKIVKTVKQIRKELRSDKHTRKKKMQHDPWRFMIFTIRHQISL